MGKDLSLNFMKTDRCFILNLSTISAEQLIGTNVPESRKTIKIEYIYFVVQK